MKAKSGTPEKKRRPTHSEGLQIAEPMLSDIPDKGSRSTPVFIDALIYIYHEEMRNRSKAIASLLARLWVEGVAKGRRRKRRSDAFEIGVITVSSRPGPEARDRLRRIITRMIKHTARDRQAAHGGYTPPSDPQADGATEAEA